MKQMYFKVYQDKDSTQHSFYVDTVENVLKSCKIWLEEHDYSGEMVPVIEPVMMDEEEFNNLPDFEGY